MTLEAQSPNANLTINPAHNEPLSAVDGACLVGKVMRALRVGHWKTRALSQWSADEPVIYFEETSHNSRPFSVPLVILRSPPCKWFVQGGCVMCNFMMEASPLTTEVTASHLLTQIEIAIERLGDLSQLPYMVVTSAGSFLSDFEVPPDVRNAILRRLREAGLRRLAFESEARYCLDEDLIAQVVREFGGEISVGIGVESWNDYVRNVAVNKGVSNAELHEAAAILHSAGVRYYHYHVLGKPFISEPADFSDTLSSIKYSLTSGAEAVVLRLVNIQPHTLTHWLWTQGLYRPPSLWSAVHLLRLLPESLRPRVAIKGIDKEESDPIAFAAGCDACTERLLGAFRDWNLSRNHELFTRIVGDCKCSNVNYSLTATDNFRIEADISKGLVAAALALGVIAPSLEN